MAKKRGVAKTRRLKTAYAGIRKRAIAKGKKPTIAAIKATYRRDQARQAATAKTRKSIAARKRKHVGMHKNRRGGWVRDKSGRFA